MFNVIVFDKEKTLPTDKMIQIIQIIENRYKLCITIHIKILKTQLLTKLNTKLSRTNDSQQE